MWKISEILSENFHFMVIEFSVYLNRLVFVMFALSIPILHMGRWLRKGILEHIWTVKIQTSRIFLSGSSLFAYTIKGHCRRYRTKRKNLDQTFGGANWSKASPFVFKLRAFLSADGPYIYVPIIIIAISKCSCIDVQMLLRYSYM